jgi:tRNA pseudouridine38-40 synthase
VGVESSSNPVGTRRIRLVVAYDGTEFCGWQMQKADRSVQQELQKALAQIHRHPVKITGAGRTDSGVHAVGQTAHFDTDLLTMPPAKFVPALNSLLPQDVRVRESCEVGKKFHARRDALSREYRYYITARDWCSPVVSPFSLSVPVLPDIRLLNQYARSIVGIHDFTAFSAAGDQSVSKIRAVYAASFYPEGRRIVFRIIGNAFLWRMVRSLIGTMLALESRQAEEGAMREILCSGDRLQVGTTAPAKGLFLYKVRYGKE